MNRINTIVILYINMKERAVWTQQMRKQTKTSINDENNDNLKIFIYFKITHKMNEYYSETKNNKRSMRTKRAQSVDEKIDSKWNNS